MPQPAISHARLMRESTDRVEAALRHGEATEQLIARRILESPQVWQLWEREHSNLMRQIASCTARRVQVDTLKQATFRLLHGKALFQYLRTSAVRGEERVRVVAHFRPGRSYEAAIVTEHGAYLRKACSFLCVNHVGADVVRDPDFLDPMQRYEQLYSEYFDLYCRALVGPPEETESQRALLPLLKHQLNEHRLAMLDPRAAQPFLRREAELRRPTGDTQRMPTLGRPKDR
ncbi:MAG TPA: hypothetical protein VME42_15195 [Steroidobacteraceae bacterium]|nr:hypothetical protein [Steroidobacteraceae bacterium]